MMIPQPFDGGSGSLHPAVLVIDLAPLDSLLVRGIIVPFDPAGTYHEYVARKKLRTLPFGNFIKVFLTDGVFAIGSVLDASMLCPRGIIEENTSSSDPSMFEPFCFVRSDHEQGLGRKRQTLDSIPVVWVWSTDLFVSQAVVVLLGLLERPVA